MLTTFRSGTEDGFTVHTDYTYDYDEQGRALRVTAAMSAVSYFSTTEYTYDANGNVLTAVTDGTDRQVYAYDSENRLIQTESYTGGSFAFYSEYKYEDRMT